jgi:hypothetical protein
VLPWVVFSGSHKAAERDSARETPISGLPRVSPVRAMAIRARGIYPANAVERSNVSEPDLTPARFPATSTSRLSWIFANHCSSLANHAVLPGTVSRVETRATHRKQTDATLATRNVTAHRIVRRAFAPSRVSMPVLLPVPASSIPDRRRSDLARCGKGFQPPAPRTLASRILSGVTSPRGGGGNASRLFLLLPWVWEARHE